MDNFIHCSVCTEMYDDRGHQAKLLNCHHSFCYSCLITLCGGHEFIICPQCRQKTPLAHSPPGGILQLQTNFYINQMKEFVQTPNMTHLKKHCKQHIELYTHFCFSCEVQLCEKCVQKVVHKMHSVSKLDKAYRMQKNLFETEVAKARENLSSTKPRVDLLNLQLPCLFASIQKAERSVEACFLSYVEALKNKKKELLADLQDLYTSERVKLSKDRDIHLKWQNSLTGLLDVCESALQYGDIHDIIFYKTELASRNGQFIDFKQLNGTANSEGSYVTFNPGVTQDSLFSSIKDLSGVSLCGKLPQEVQFQDPATATAGLFSNISFKVIDGSDPKTRGAISVQINDTSDNSILAASTRHRGDCNYEVVFRPQVSGSLVLQLFMDEQLISKVSLPVVVISNDPVAQIGRSGNALGQLDYPQDVALKPSGELLVANTGNNCIEIFKGTEPHEATRIPISDEGERLSACGLLVDTVHHMIICLGVAIQDAEIVKGNTLLFYTYEGVLKYRVNLEDILHKASSIAINSAGQLLVADVDLCQIFVFDQEDKSLIRKFGEKGKDPGQFGSPTYICVGENDCVIVSDAYQDKVQVFDKMGSFLYRLGTCGAGKGEFTRPFGVCVDVHGNILVADGGNRRLLVFKCATGEFISCIESLASPLLAPRGICATQDGHVYVADRDNHSVKQYRYLKSTLL